MGKSLRLAGVFIMEEIWKDIIGYEGLYQVSNMGRVKALTKTFYSGKKYSIKKTYNEKILRQCVRNKEKGYLVVSLSKCSKSKLYFVHRLVATAFLLKDKNKNQINHKDYNKQNNLLNNIEWCDAFENQKHAAIKPNRRWTTKKMFGVDNHKSRAVSVFSTDGLLVGNYQSQSEAAKCTNSDNKKISLCCNRIRKSHNNLIFKFT